jgi:hypothetical protein
MPCCRRTKQPSTAARDRLRTVAPKLIEYTDKLLFDEVWERPGLSKRDRSLITVAALVALYRGSLLISKRRSASRSPTSLKLKVKRCSKPCRTTSGGKRCGRRKSFACPRVALSDPERRITVSTPPYLMTTSNIIPRRYLRRWLAQM